MATDQPNTRWLGWIREQLHAGPLKSHAWMNHAFSLLAIHLEHMNTLAPSLPSLSAIACPIPAVAAVTRATLPSSLRQDITIGTELLLTANEYV